jgi:hypothetical protein
MTNETGGDHKQRILTRGPNGGNPTPTRQERSHEATWHRGPRGPSPARGRLVEAIGARPFRAKAKRREASVVGESARSDEARYPLVPRAYGRRDGLEVSWSYLVRSAGLREGGRPEDDKTEADDPAEVRGPH